MCRSELHVLCAFASLRAALDQPWPQQLAQGNQELTRLRFGLVLVKDIGQPQTNVNKNEHGIRVYWRFSNSLPNERSTPVADRLRLWNEALSDGQLSDLFGHRLQDPHRKFETENRHIVRSNGVLLANVVNGTRDATIIDTIGT